MRDSKYFRAPGTVETRRMRRTGIGFAANPPCETLLCNKVPSSPNPWIRERSQCIPTSRAPSPPGTACSMIWHCSARRPSVVFYVERAYRGAGLQALYAPHTHCMSRRLAHSTLHWRASAFDSKAHQFSVIPRRR